MICYHHNDLDGRMAMAVCKRAFESLDVPQVYVEHDYKDDFVLPENPEHETIVLLDWTPTPAQWDQLLSTPGVDRVIWIDHHSSNIRRALELNVFAAHRHDPFPGCRWCTDSHPQVHAYLSDTKPAACMLAWNYWFLRESPPRAIELADDWDTWTHEFPDSRLLRYGMDLHEAHSLRYLELVSPDLIEREIALADVLGHGQIIAQYRYARAREYRSAFGHYVTFMNLKAFAINVALANSDWFLGREYDDDCYIWIAYAHDGRRWRVSVYQAPGCRLRMDTIAADFGGGGHPGAAGFVCNELPWRTES